MEKCVKFCYVLHLYSYFSLIKLINNSIFWCVTVSLLCSINVTIYLSAYFTTMNDKCETPVPKKSLLLYVELFKKNMLKKSKMQPHCDKWKKCARTAPNAKKMWHIRKNPKSAGFLCSTKSHFFPGCNIYMLGCKIRVKKNRYEIVKYLL